MSPQRVLGIVTNDFIRTRWRRERSRLTALQELRRGVFEKGNDGLEDTRCCIPLLYAVPWDRNDSFGSKGDIVAKMMDGDHGV